MIITRTPLRISFVGGGTDFKDFYRCQPGMVVSTAINKYMYVVVHKRFEGNIRLSYTRMETVNHIDEIQHELIREAMKLSGVDAGIEINTVSDVPGWGTGLGSSSSLTVGVLNALHAFKGEYKSPEELAKEACQIEIDILGEPIGKQDQYIAAYGGLKAFTFQRDEEVLVEEIPINEEQKISFNSNLLLFYTGKTRKAQAILAKQKTNIEEKMEALVRMRDLAKAAKKSLISAQFDAVGRMLHKNWLEKKQLAEGISDEEIDYYYQKALDNGALGGKICGAGGGGFLLLYCEKKYQDKVRQALVDLKETPFRLESQGSEVIYHDKNI